jgi:hypothetical protein
VPTLTCGIQPVKARCAHGRRDLCAVVFVMRALRTTSPARIHRKLCLACGFDGHEIQHLRFAECTTCPHCGEDLGTRPPRSYAELEGLDDDLGPILRPTRGPQPIRPHGPWRKLLGALRRWLTQPKPF